LTNYLNRYILKLSLKGGDNKMETSRSYNYSTHQYEVWGVKDGVAVILSIEPEEKESEDIHYVNDNPNC